MYIFGNLKAGFLNAWLGVLLIFLASWTILATDKKARRRLSSTSWCSPREKKLVWSGTFLLFVIFVFSIFVPLQLNTNWFYIGIAIFLVGYICLVISYFNYIKTAGDKSKTKGFYNISRNPIYLFTSVALLGISIASASLIMLILVIIHFIISHFVILAEERHFLHIYKNTYKKYMKRVRRYFLFF